MNNELKNMLLECISIWGIVSVLAVMLWYADKLEEDLGIKNNMLSSGTTIDGWYKGERGE